MYSHQRNRHPPLISPPRSPLTIMNHPHTPSQTPCSRRPSRVMSPLFHEPPFPRRLSPRPPHLPPFHVGHPPADTHVPSPEYRNGIPIFPQAGRLRSATLPGRQNPPLWDRSASPLPQDRPSIGEHPGTGTPHLFRMDQVWGFPPPSQTSILSASRRRQHLDSPLRGHDALYHRTPALRHMNHPLPPPIPFPSSSVSSTSPRARYREFAPSPSPPPSYSPTRIPSYRSREDLATFRAGFGRGSFLGQTALFDDALRCRCSECDCVRDADINGRMLTRAGRMLCGFCRAYHGGFGVARGTIPVRRGIRRGRN
ncbi:hypothetical protein C8035_v007299 [Colletotrichum spinosum]|uniref:Uncharacterized protein n=1 Tax=Colletotrichum spinosum TaxID=1347390 RepID=A0A4R8PTB5_9PEZI|nr:hypothetical protein C8035_v007299 [Colletotrichum spinosum]